MARMYEQGMEIVPGFRLMKPLGRGGFGEVWKATAPGGTEVAIKIISLGERYGFKEFRAVQLVKQIRHPNLVPIVAFWLLNEEGKQFQEIVGDNTMARKAQELDLIIAMGLGDKNLIDRLKECQKEGKPGIPAEELLNYMEDAAKAIDYLNQPIHDLGEGLGGINHCDIKPQNILIVGGAAQVCDFGLARVLGDTRVTSAKGSAAYMAPEMITENKPTRTTDQYFLAISYIELRTGSLPINVASPAAAIWAHVQGKLDLSKLSSAEQEVIRRAAAVKPEDRYDTTMEMVRALRQAIEGGGQSQRVSRVVKPDELVKPGSEIVPGYKLSRMLGKGGYGQVWEATAPGGKKVALKIIKNLEGVHGRQEFKALELIKGVDHNHLMELHAYWLLDRKGNIIPDEDRERADAPEPSTLVIASKLANKNLLQRLNECLNQGLKGVPLDELLGYMRQAAQAIDYLNTMQHPMGERRVSIQHRDIKPENILLAADVVKVGDFGLAKVVEGSSAVIHGDSAGLTLAYAAPEMFTNLVTAWTDQYCLALTYFKLRTSAWPFPESSKPNEIIKSHIMGKLDLSKLPESERAVIARATAVKPEARFPSCQAMVDELERACRPAGDDDSGVPSLRRSAPSPQPGVPSEGEGAGDRLSRGAPWGKSAAPALPSTSSQPDVASPKSVTAADMSVPAPFGTLTPEKELPPELSETHIVQSEAASSDTSHPVPTPPSDSSAPTLTHNSNRPTTSERIVVQTKGHVELPPESVRMQAPPSVRAPAGWKDGAAKKPAAKTATSPVKVLAGLLILAGIAAGAAYATREMWAPLLLDRSDKITSEVNNLIEAHQYTEALAKTNAWGVKPEVAGSLKDQIRTSWITDARKELIDQKNYEQAFKTAQDLVERYPDDAEAKSTLASARLAADIAAVTGKGTDFPAAERKLAESSGVLDDSIRTSLRADLLRSWLAHAKKDLFEEREFRRAQQDVTELLKVDKDNKEAKRIERQAQLAVEVQDMIQQEKKFENADRTLDLAGTELSEELKRSLRGDVLRAWIEQARKEFGSKKYDEAARTIGELLARFPGNAEAMSIRDTMGREVLSDAQKALALATARIHREKSRDATTTKLLNQAVANAERAYKVYELKDPEVFLVRAKSNELLGKPEDALAAYEAGLPLPAKAGAEQLALLIARIEFLINPHWEQYRAALGYNEAKVIQRLIDAADRAFELSESGSLDQATKAHAIAIGGLTRIQYLSKAKNVQPDKVQELRTEAIARLRTALAQKSDHPDGWRWRYELANQLRYALIGAKPDDEKKMRAEAISLLQQATANAPTDELKRKIIPLLEELERKN